jgi:inner membrane protein
MIIGHIPAGYLCAKYLYRFSRHFGCGPRAFTAAAMIGATAPDIDLIYFYLIDHRQHHHHTYWTHYPVLWLGLMLLSTLWLLDGRRKAAAALATIFSVNGFLHMLLDSVVGDIWWLAPWVDRPFALATVQRVHEPWWINFILHWSFAIELVLVFITAVVWWRAGNPALWSRRLCGRA